MNKIQIISGSSNIDLADRIAKKKKYQLLNADVSKYSDGEIKVIISDTINQEVIVVQSTNPPVNDNLMELLLIVDAAKRAGAQSIKVIAPYFGYSRQDKCVYKNGTIAINLVMKMIETAGATQIVTLDLHSPQSAKLFNIPIINLTTEDVFCPILRNKEDLIIISPDSGGIERAKKYASLLKTDYAIINKHRDTNDKCYMNRITGDVSGKNCIIVDDIVDSADTICKATELLIGNGAKTVETIATHPVLSRNATKKIENSLIKKIYVSDTIRHQKLPTKFTVLPSHELLSTIL